MIEKFYNLLKDRDERGLPLTTKFTDEEFKNYGIENNAFKFLDESMLDLEVAGRYMTLLIDVLQHINATKPLHNVKSILQEILTFIDKNNKTMYNMHKF